ncbi:hypothetical protein IV203_029354 [Nitzschia inconspicua]|uniref:Uncharacterized protein n=1 Tax=Nitzschia inconspicua TaxID=303405 RepID=A0A9K3LRM9_9STRA|nr:hypothetical protein IV203_029354 [Nitzschia inconspicua]
MVEESFATQEEIVGESFHSNADPVASALLASLATAGDLPGQGDVEGIDFEDPGENMNTYSSVEAGPIPEEIQNVERHDLTSAYDPNAEYNASDFSSDEDEEETEEDDGKEVVEEEFVEEIIEYDNRGIEDALPMAALSKAVQQSGQDAITDIYIENQSKPEILLFRMLQNGATRRDGRYLQAPSGRPTITSIPTAFPSPTIQPPLTSSPTPSLTFIIPSSLVIPQTNPPTSSPFESLQHGENDTCDTSVGPLMSDGSSNFDTAAGALVDDNIQCGDIVNSGPVVFGNSCDDLVCVEANDIFVGKLEHNRCFLVFSLSRGIPNFRIRESGFADGSFNLVIESRSNDECSTAIGPLPVVDPVPVTGNTLNATPNAITCDGVTNESPSIWYLVTETCSQLTTDVCDNTDLYFRDSCAGLECIAVSGIIDCSLTWESVEIHNYYIMISGLSAGVVGSFSLTVTSAV